MAAMSLPIPVSRAGWPSSSRRSTSTARSILIRDGDILTSPGMSASVDLALSLIEADYGYTAAVDVAKYLVLYLKRSVYDKQVSNDLMLQE